MQFRRPRCRGRLKSESSALFVCSKVHLCYVVTQRSLIAAFAPQKLRNELISYISTPGTGPTIQTLATKQSGKVFSAPEVVVFEDPRKRKKVDQPEKPVENQSKPVDKKKAQLEAELSMKQTR